MTLISCSLEKLWLYRGLTDFEPDMPFRARHEGAVAAVAHRDREPEYDYRQARGLNQSDHPHFDTHGPRQRWYGPMHSNHDPDSQSLRYAGRAVCVGASRDAPKEGSDPNKQKMATDWPLDWVQTVPPADEPRDSHPINYHGIIFVPTDHPASLLDRFADTEATVKLGWETALSVSVSREQTAAVAII